MENTPVLPLMAAFGQKTSILIFSETITKSRQVLISVTLPARDSLLSALYWVDLTAVVSKINFFGSWTKLFEELQTGIFFAKNQQVKPCKPSQKGATAAGDPFYFHCSLQQIKRAHFINLASVKGPQMI